METQVYMLRLLLFIYNLPLAIPIQAIDKGDPVLRGASLALTNSSVTTNAKGYWMDVAANCHYIFGLPKFTWALLCDVLALALVLLCIPLLLTCARRRPPGAPLLDCQCGGPSPMHEKRIASQDAMS